MGVTSQQAEVIYIALVSRNLGFHLRSDLFYLYCTAPTAKLVGAASGEIW